MRRTDQQNKALHKYCSMLADALNDAGLDMRKTLKPEIEIPWSGESVKEQLWRPIMVAMLEKTSTTELTRSEVSAVYDVLDRHLSSKLGISLAFPKEKHD